MNYKKIYRSIVLRAKSENRQKGFGVYFEKHHVIPNFMFADRKGRQGPKGHLAGECDSAENLVLLTAREHFICHVLLVKIHKGSRYENSAKKSLVWFFTSIESSEHARNEWFIESSSKKFARYREIAISGMRESMVGSMLVKDAITGVKIGRVSTNHPNVVSGVWVHWSKGRKFTAEQLINHSKAHTGMNNPKARPDITPDVILGAVCSGIVELSCCGQRLKKPDIDKILKMKLQVSSIMIRSRFESFDKFINQLIDHMIAVDLEPIKYFPRSFKGIAEAKEI